MKFSEFFEKFKISINFHIFLRINLFSIFCLSIHNLINIKIYIQHFLNKFLFYLFTKLFHFFAFL